MKKIFLIFLLGCCYITSAQFNRPYQKGDTLHYDKWYRTIDKALATQFMIIKDIQTQEKKKMYLLERYELDLTSKEPTKKEVFSSTSVRWISREGKNTIFWENGKKKEEGKRKKGKLIGIWKNWYKDGTIMSEHEYFEPEDTPKSKQKGYHLVNFWNRKGELMVKDGTGNYFLKYDDGDEVQGEMIRYNKEGLWKGFRKNGSKKYEEIYKEGELVQGESWDEEGNRYTYITLYEKGEYSEGRNGLVRMISENFKVPKYASEMGIEGTTKIGFEVNKEGKIDNIEVVWPLCEPCDQEAIRVVKLLENWKPAKRRGQNSRMKYTLPFRIKLTAK